MTTVVKTDEWNSALLKIVNHWKSSLSKVYEINEDTSWMQRFNLCEPWEFAHMANIVLWLNLPTEFPKKIYDESNDLDYATSAAFAKVMGEVAIDYSNVEKQEIFAIHEQLLELGGNYIRRGMPPIWSELTWTDFLSLGDRIATSEFRSLKNREKRAPAHRYAPTTYGFVI